MSVLTGPSLWRLTRSLRDNKQTKLSKEYWINLTEISWKGMLRWLGNTGLLFPWSAEQNKTWTHGCQCGWNCVDADADPEGLVGAKGRRAWGTGPLPQKGNEFYHSKWRFGEFFGKSEGQFALACPTENSGDSFPCSWLRGPAVEHWPLADVLSLSYARLVADGWPLMWVSHPL